jgi:hypothetical protein
MTPTLPLTAAELPPLAELLPPLAVLLLPLLPPHAATASRSEAERAVVVRMRRRAMEVLPFRRGYREIPCRSLRDKWWAAQGERASVVDP